MGTLGAGLAVAALALAGAGAAILEAQESDNRTVIAPRGRTLSFAQGSGGYLGVGIMEVDADEASEAGVSARYGVYISTVSDDSPASEAGIEEGDVIVRWNGERLEGVAQLQRLVRETPVGRTVELTVMRGSSEREISLALAEASNAPTFALPGGDRFELRRGMDAPLLDLRDGQGSRSFIFSRRPRLGASIQSLGEQLADYFGVEGGALVTEVSADSPAEAAGLRAGDVIVELAGETVEGPGDLLELLAEQEAGEVEMRIYRDGSARTLTVEIEEPGDEARFPGAWRNGDNIRFRSGDGDDLSIEPMTLDGWELGPIEFDGFEMEPFEWNFDLNGLGDGNGIQISIPRIEIPGFDLGTIEIPDIHVPGLSVRGPRMHIII